MAPLWGSREVSADVLNRQPLATNTLPSAKRVCADAEAASLQARYYHARLVRERSQEHDSNFQEARVFLLPLLAPLTPVFDLPIHVRQIKSDVVSGPF